MERQITYTLLFNNNGGRYGGLFFGLGIAVASFFIFFQNKKDITESPTTPFFKA
ncbi:protein of unknown function [Tenacibaculum aestuariivivum]